METLVIFLMAIIILYYWLKKPVSVPAQTKSAPTQQQDRDGLLIDMVVNALDGVHIARKNPLFEELANEHFHFIKDDILESDDPFIKNRLWFTTNVIKLAIAQVLTLTPNCKSFLFNHPAISGTLNPYLIQIVGQDESFAYVKEQGIPKEEWSGLVDDRLRISVVRTNLADRIRTLMPKGTMEEKDDWMRPALMAMCIHEEDKMRRNIGMKPFFNSHFSGFLYASLLGHIAEGHADPLQIWNQKLSEVGRDFDGDEIYLPSCEREIEFGSRNVN